MCWRVGLGADQGHLGETRGNRIHYDMETSLDLEWVCLMNLKLEVKLKYPKEHTESSSSASFLATCSESSLSAASLEVEFPRN